MSKRKQPTLVQLREELEKLRLWFLLSVAANEGATFADPGEPRRDEPMAV